jgi:hypothetical protein
MKKINKTSLIDLDDNQLGALSTIVNIDIYTGNIPFLGRVVCYDGKRICEKTDGNMPQNQYFETCLQTDVETGRVVRIFIGSKHHGQIMSCHIDHAGKAHWYNSFCARNYGKNYASGGNWTSINPTDGYTSWQDALVNRHVGKGLATW